MKVKMLTVYCAAHFLVDLCCALFMFSLLRNDSSWMMGVLVYNFCAFALQMPFGITADRLNRNSFVAAVGCLLVAGGVFVPHLITAAGIVGCGNALFHVGGGIDVLNMSKKKCTPLGLFVSPGAIGLSLGTMMAGKIPLYAATIVMLVVGTVILLTAKSEFKGLESENTELKMPKLTITAVIAVICLFLVVCLRSFAGMSFSFEWKSSMPAIISVIFIAAGKALGGIAADRIGAKAASIISLGLCAVLFLFSDIPACGLAALLLFNMTMPITLWETAKIFPDAKGFSFGLLTFALFIGFLPVYFGASPFTEALSAITSLASLALLLAGIRRRKDVA